MNKIVNTFLLTGDKFLSKLHLRQPGFTCGDCGPFTKYCERIRKFKETSYVNYMYKNGLYKACLAHGAPYCDSKDLAKRTISDKILKDRAYEIAINPKYDSYQRVLASMVYKFFDKETGLGTNVSEVLAQELHKPVIKIFKEGKSIPV